MAAWISAGKGIRYREHATRKHGKKLDRYWCIQYKLHGRNINEAVGWWSDGTTQGQCEELLATLRINQKNGQGPQTLKEMRDLNKEKRAAKAAERHLTLKGFWESEYLPQARLSISERAIYEQKCLMGKWLAPLADRHLNEITPSDLENLIIRPMLEDGRSPTYVEKVLRILSVIWNRAKTSGLAQGDNPVSKIKIPKKDSNRDRFLNKDEAVKLLSYLKRHHPDVHDMAVLSLFSGMRIGECLKLTWADVNMEDGTIFVKDTKTTRNRHAHMTSEIREMLSRRYNGQSKTGKVFYSEEGGNSYSSVWQRFKAAVDDLGFNEGITDSRQKAVIHTLRHTFASWQVQLGTPLYTVSQLLGHSDIKMTMRYAHLAPDSKRAAALDLEDFLNIDMD